MDGNPTIISQAFIDKLPEWPQIKAHQAKKKCFTFFDLLVKYQKLKRPLAL